MTEATLVLLPSIALDDTSWRWLDLPADVRVATPVYPGHGTTGDWLPGVSLDDVADMIAAAYPGPLEVAGISLGGILAQHLAVRHPDRVRSLLIAGTTAHSDPATMTGRAEAVESNPNNNDYSEQTLRRWFTSEALAQVPEHPGVAYARRRLAAMPGRSFGAAWRAMAGHDLRGRLRGLPARVTIVAGQGDQAAPPEAMREFAAEFDRPRFEVLAAPHLMQLETPEAFSAVLRRHLSPADVAS
ncbi:MAG: hypothetical protein J2P26_04520 [Nocardiopsaceae bacterium]|nr:hypothetical protein [Nocardiopsaceae bacterium]